MSRPMKVSLQSRGKLTPHMQGALNDKLHHITKDVADSWDDGSESP